MRAERAALRRLGAPTLVPHKSRGRSVPVASAPSCLAALLVHLRPSPSRKVLHTARDRRSEPGLPHEPAIVTSIEHALTRRTCARVDSSVHAPSASRLAARVRSPSLGPIRVRDRYSRRTLGFDSPKRRELRRGKLHVHRGAGEAADAPAPAGCSRLRSILVPTICGPMVAEHDQPGAEAGGRAREEPMAGAGASRCER